MRPGWEGPGGLLLFEGSEINNKARNPRTAREAATNNNI